MKPINTTVFSDGEGGGNPAPVFLGADVMTEAEMQQAAFELGQEAVFVTKPLDGANDVRLQYFVPDHELTICAHDTIGAITVLVQEGLVKKENLKVETKAGTVQVDWVKKDDKILVMMEQFLPEFSGKVPSAEAVAEALQIPISDFCLGEMSPLEAVSTSRFKLMVPVKSREVLDGLHPDFEKLWACCDACACSGFYVYAQDEADKNVFYARQYPLRSGYLEDPATGIAATALGAYAVKNGLVKKAEGWNRMAIYQGHAMGRPSLIYADICVKDGEIAGVRVSGSAERTEESGRL